MLRTTWKRDLFRTTAIAGALLSCSAVHAQVSDAKDSKPDAPEAEEVRPDDIIVTARRSEERLQDVPISITVFNQEQLTNRNIVNASDLAAYTPSLSTTPRFGSDTATFAIRGFTQEFRTTSSVAVYFADVVAPRGGGSITAGEGSGPGSFFDLQNVQVLKGPQGTLFGRNTTGGAVLLVPRKPTDQLEGYVEGSYGNYDMRRLQGVVNVPLGDRARFRAGVDWQKRDGFLDNVSGIGPRHLGDINYIAGRASLDIDLTPTLENYTVASITHSDNHGTVPQLFACNTAVPFFGQMCAEQLERTGSDGYVVSSKEANPKSQIDQWQVINTTSWNASDAVTVKNIASYAEIKSTLRNNQFGDFYFPSAVTGLAPFPIPTGPLAGTPFTFVNSEQVPGYPTNYQTTFSDEIQVQGHSLNGRLAWQGGFYLESSLPHGVSGSLSQNQIYCSDAPAHNCFDVLAAFAGPLAVGGGQLPPATLPFFSIGSLQQSLGTISYNNKAVYAQATYKLADQFKVTGGIRYTWDRTRGTSEEIAYSFPPYGTPSAACVIPTRADGTPNSLASNCRVELRQNSQAPTWLVDLDYTPSDDILLYAKYARGYRQGSVNIFGPPGYNVFGPEHVDSYEVGAKTSFHGALSGIFNVAGFYNDFRNQQIQAGFFENNPTNGVGVPTTSIVNAGTSRIWGVEVETSVNLFKGFRVDGSYTYLNTELISLSPVTPLAPYDIAFATSNVGGPLPSSPKHKVAVTPSYTLPLDPSIGRVTLSATYVYTDKRLVATGTPFGVLPSFHLLNLNLNWNSVAGSPVDLSVFATNVTDEKVPVYVAGLYDQAGQESRELGEPRMYGVRLRVNFGNR